MVIMSVAIINCFTIPITAANILRNDHTTPHRNPRHKKTVLVLKKISKLDKTRIWGVAVSPQDFPSSQLCPLREGA